MNFAEWLKPVVAAIAGMAIAALLNYNTVTYRITELESEKRDMEIQILNLQILANTLENRISSNRSFIRHNCRRLDTVEEATELPVQDDCGRPY